MRRVHAMPFGAEITDEGVRFALWAPSAKNVSLLLDGAEHPMPDLGGGWRRLSVPEARAGQRYAFRIDGGLVVPDPAARFQPEDVHRASEVIDPRAYAWSDEAWAGRPWEETVLYELHVGTATREGTFAALMTKLEDLKEVGITAIELMPIAEFPGRRNWGYDERAAVCAGRGLWLAERSQAPHRPGARPRSLDVPRRRLQPFRAVGELSRCLRKLTSLRTGTERLGASASMSTGPRPGRSATSSFTTLSTGSRNTTSTACVSTRFMRFGTRANGIFSPKSPRGSGQRSPNGPAISSSRTI